MKVFVDKGDGFFNEGETDLPEAIKILQENFEEYVDANGDLVFNESDLDVYYGKFIPLLKKYAQPD